MAKKKETNSGFSDGLKTALAALNTSYGEEIAGMMDDANDVTMEYVPTGSLILDSMIIGYPKNKIIEIVGEPSLGKSSMALAFLAQYKGQPTLYIDSEDSLDRDYAKRIGVDTSMMIVSAPPTIEDGMTVLLDLVEHVSAVVFDSIAEFATKNEIEKDISAMDIGVKSRLMSKLIRKLKAKKHNATIMFINQVRQNPNNPYNPRTFPGGNAIPFAAHLRLDLYGKDPIKKGSGESEEIIGHRIKLKCLKNKTGKPLGKLQIPIIYDSYGISKSQEVIDLCVDAGIILKSGSWFSHKETRLGQGEDKVRQFLNDNKEYRDQLEKELRDKIRLLNNSSSAK